MKTLFPKLIATLAATLVMASATLHAAPLAEADKSLLIEAPGGEQVQLVYVDGQGWSYGQDSADAAPLSLFIDGPTGFTYVWTTPKGWRFVGRVKNAG